MLIVIKVFTVIAVTGLAWDLGRRFVSLIFGEEEK
jgi:hypothetical protein